MRKTIYTGAIVASLALVACRGDMSDGISELISPIDAPGPSGPDGSLRHLTGAQCGAPAATSAGHVYFRLSEQQRVYRMEATAGAKPQDISSALDKFGPGTDTFVSASENGEWILIGTTRFGCGEQACAAVVSADLCTAQVINAGGATVSPDAAATISSDGNVVVFPGQGGPHPRDMFAVKRASNTAPWGSPVPISASSTHPFHQQPQLNADGTMALMDCGTTPGSESGTAICEASTDGTMFRTVLSPEFVPVGSPPHDPQNLVHAPAYEPSGGIVFESEFDNSEQIWHLAPGATEPTLVNADTNASGFIFTNDNSPCALPDGRIVSLWLGRAGSGARGAESGHELKLANPDGSGERMLLINANVDDIGIYCTK